MTRYSVVVPAYHAASDARRHARRDCAQTFIDWECVVVDDGSTDDTSAIASRYASTDPRFHVIHQDNRGTAGAYNAGVGAAIGDFIVLCSADDILLSCHLVRMVRFIDDEPGYDIYSTNGYWWRPGDYRETATVRAPWTDRLPESVGRDPSLLLQRRRQLQAGLVRCRWRIPRGCIRRGLRLLAAGDGLGADTATCRRRSRCTDGAPARSRRASSRLPIRHPDHFRLEAGLQLPPADSRRRGREHSRPRSRLIADTNLLLGAVPGRGASRSQASRRPAAW